MDSPDSRSSGAFDVAVGLPGISSSAKKDGGKPVGAVGTGLIGTLDASGAFANGASVVEGSEITGAPREFDRPLKSGFATSSHGVQYYTPSPRKPVLYLQ
jgi:hypothetical protein